MKRGLVLDGVVLGANLVAMPPLTNVLAGVLRRATANEPAAMALLFGLAVALFVLAPLGATLSRWHYHQRQGSGERGEGSDVLQGAAGCLFNPIFYFCLTAVIFAAVNAFLMQRLFGNRDPGGAVFAVSLIGGIALMVTHTWLVYRYFTPPKAPPRSAFMRGPLSAALGDAALFANMLLYQCIWNLLEFAGVGPPGGVVEGAGRLLVLLFLALLLYFPPRMFYLAEDLAGERRRWTWLTILAANAPVIVRLMLGSAK